VEKKLQSFNFAVQVKTLNSSSAIISFFEKAEGLPNTKGCQRPLVAGSVCRQRPALMFLTF